MQDTVLKQLVEERKITQRKLAKDAGLEQDQVSRILTGKQRPYGDQIARLAGALGLSPKERSAVDADLKSRFPKTQTA